MKAERQIEALIGEAEDLKSNLVAYMESQKREHKGIKQTMNELLDLLDELNVDLHHGPCLVNSNLSVTHSMYGKCFLCEGALNAEKSREEK